MNNKHKIRNGKTKNRLPAKHKMKIIKSCSTTNKSRKLIIILLYSS
jgi:hypothetical protein